MNDKSKQRLIAFYWSREGKTFLTKKLLGIKLFFYANIKCQVYQIHDWRIKDIAKAINAGDYESISRQQLENESKKIPENTWHKWYDWLINYILKSNLYSNLNHI